ncbi:hypothetical protein TCEL_01893 [Thermobrachium celere DSM 8682]|uniref:Uncharacterized protein n=1 Tax=Thermobrachium celere DSM 8682 TaxID=941824 RepID=R7RPK4_9CLOT|nr:hypothetical protein TCEL_01893 [Thermobrachium celere DSM 8682]
MFRFIIFLVFLFIFLIIQKELFISIGNKRKIKSNRKNK